MGWTDLDVLVHHVGYVGSPMPNGRTCLVIAHDVDTVALAHRVLRLKDGRVVTECHADRVAARTPHVPEPPRGLIAGLIERTS